MLVQKLEIICLLCLKLVNKNGTSTWDSSKDDAGEGKGILTGVEEGAREKAAY